MGQGFSSPAVATVITASSIVTFNAPFVIELVHVATVITASSIVTQTGLPSNFYFLVATVITASSIVTYGLTHSIRAPTFCVATVITASSIVTDHVRKEHFKGCRRSCNSDNCKQYCDPQSGLDSIFFERGCGLQQ